LSEFAKRSEIQVVADLEEIKLADDSALSVYRLVQEALTNVASMHRRSTSRSTCMRTTARPS